jgi:hypothetical protein
MTDTTDAMSALSDALLDLTHHDRRPPCGDGSDRWVSDDRDQRDEAVRSCQSCPLTEVCRQYADEIRASFGVYGGHDYTPDQRQTAT